MNLEFMLLLIIFLCPSITKYELKLETGTRVNKIMSLQDDIKLALAAKDIRIECAYPWKTSGWC